MKKIIVAVIAIATIAVMAIYAQKNEKVTIDDEGLIKLESLAEQIAIYRFWLPRNDSSDL